MIIDSHCHLHDLAFTDLRETLRTALAHDVWGVVAVGCDASTNARTRAAFHWHKAPADVTRAIVEAGYYVSVTPEVVYRDRDREMVAWVPLDSLLVESDGPWKSGGEFDGLPSGPWFTSRVGEEIAKLKQMPAEDVVHHLSTNACRLFDLVWA